MAYADYSFYQSRGGRMSLSEFSVYSEKASDYIDYITNDKSKAYVDTEDRLKKCCSVLCDEIKRLEKSDGIASESIGSYSVSFKDTNVKKQYANVCRTFIGSTGLMYRGL